MGRAPACWSRSCSALPARGCRKCQSQIRLAMAVVVSGFSGGLRPTRRTPCAGLDGAGTGRLLGSREDAETPGFTFCPFANGRAGEHACFLEFAFGHAVGGHPDRRIHRFNVGVCAHRKPTARRLVTVQFPFEPLESLAGATRSLRSLGREAVELGRNCLQRRFPS